MVEWEVNNAQKDIFNSDDSIKVNMHLRKSAWKEEPAKN